MAKAPTHIFELCSEHAIQHWFVNGLSTATSHEICTYLRKTRLGAVKQSSRMTHATHQGVTHLLAKVCYCYLLFLVDALLLSLSTFVLQLPLSCLSFYLLPEKLSHSTVKLEHSA